MVTATVVRALPGPKSFYGVKNILDLSQDGMLRFIEEGWRTYGDIFAVTVGPRKLVMVIHPDHVRHITVTNAGNYDKLESYDPVRKYIVGDGLITSTGELWKRQRRLMAPGAAGNGAAHRHDGVQLAARGQPRGTLGAAAHDLKGLAERPRQGVAGIKNGRLA